MDEVNHPRHVGIILDGNRRYAKKLSKEPWKGHKSGAEKVEKLITWAINLDIKELSLFCFSWENSNRPGIEIEFLMRLFEEYFDKLQKDERLEKNKVKVCFVGRKEVFSSRLQEKMRNLEKKTEDHENFRLNFLMGYGGRREITDAAKKIAENVEQGILAPEDIKEETITKNMYLSSEPDLVIRTSEQRLSGFLAWQTVYSEIIFLPDILWPEFSEEIFKRCLDEYSSRKRRFGK